MHLLPYGQKESNNAGAFNQAYVCPPESPLLVAVVTIVVRRDIRSTNENANSCVVETLKDFLNRSGVSVEEVIRGREE